MTAIISNNTLGLMSSSLDPSRTLSVGGSGSPGQSGEALYVNVATGNLVVQRQDEMLKARGLDIDTLLTYNSQGQLDGDNNDNWRIGFYRQVKSLTGTVNIAGSTVIRVDADGAERTYAYDDVAKRYVSTQGDGSHDSLQYNGSANLWTWTDGDSRVTESYGWSNGSGRLTARNDAAGNTTSYVYDDNTGLLKQVKNPAGESTFLNYTGLNLSRLRTVRSDNSTSTRTLYAYDAANRLASITVDLSPDDNSVTDNKTYVSRYTYDGTSRRIATLTQSDGTSLGFTYDINGKIKSITDALGNQANYIYDSVNRITTVTDALGLQTRYSYDNAGQLTQITSPPVNGSTITQSFSFNAKSDIASVTDGEGKTVTYSYDANGNQTLQRDAVGNTVTRSYNVNNQLLTETTYLVPDPDGDGAQQAGTPLTTNYVYDDAGKNQLRFIISPQGRVTEHRYDVYGQRTSSIDYVDNNYAATTVTENALATWVGSTANKARSQRTDYAYDFRGQVSTVTTYADTDSAGNGISSSASVTQYTYDPAGRLIKTIAPTGNDATQATTQTTTYTYDALGRLVTETNGLNQTTQYQYADMPGNSNVRTGTRLFASGLKVISSYDRAGRLVSVMQSDGAGSNLGTTRYFYDAENRLVMTEDAVGIKTWNFYDAADRKVGEVDGNGTLTEFVYDKNGQVTQSIAYANSADTSVLTTNSDGSPSATALARTLLELRPAASPDDQKSWNLYDAAGHLIRAVDAGGSVTATEYDGDDRVIKVIRYATPVDISLLGSSPTLAQTTPIENSGDRITRHLYDKDGLLCGAIDGEGYLTEFFHDHAGQAWQSLRYATQLSNATLASIISTSTVDNLRPARTSNDIQTFTFHDDQGRVVGEIDGQNALTEYSYAKNGNRTQTRTYANPVDNGLLASLNSNTDPGTLRPAIHVADQTSSTSYDGLNRIEKQTDVEGTVTRYRYDNAGNLIQTDRALDVADELRTSRARYDLQGRMTAELSGEGSAALAALGNTPTQSQIDAVWTQYGQRYAYDAADRLASNTDPLGNRTLYFYDNDSQLVYTINELGEVVGHTYNGLEQKSSTTHYCTPISVAALSTLFSLGGGSVNSTLTNAITAIANATLDSTTRYAYNPDGTLLNERDALGNLTVYQYNAFGEQTSVTLPIDASNSVTKAYTYDRRGLQRSSTTDGSGLNINASQEYDAFGRVTKAFDGKGNAATYQYDRLGRRVQLTDATGNTTITTYDVFERVIRQQDGRGNATATSYDPANRKVTITTPDGSTVVTTYNRHGQTQAVTDGNGNVTTYEYDRNGNLKQTILPPGPSGNRTTTQSYDAGNRLIQSVDANGVKTVYTYDAVNRILSQTIDPSSTTPAYTGLNIVTQYRYDAKGQQIRVIAPNGSVTRYEFDLNGQIVKQTIDEGAGKLNLVTRYEYDGQGNQFKVTDANGNVSRNFYDKANRLQYTVDAEGAVAKYEYDANGNVVQKIAYANPIASTVLAKDVVADASRDQVTRNVYDAANRLQYTVDGVGAVTKYEYDANGNMVSKMAYAAPIPTSNSLKVAYTSGASNTTLRSSVAVNAGETVTMTVRFRTDAKSAARTYIGTHSAWMTGNGEWQTLTITHAVTSTAQLWCYIDLKDLDSTSHPNGGYALFDDLTITSNQRGIIFTDAFDNIGPWLQASSGSGSLQHINVANPNTAIANALRVDPDRDQATRNTYDAANRLQYTVDGIGAVTKYEYDANGNVVQKTAYANTITASTLANDVVADASRDQVTRNVYDAANRLQYTVDAVGAVTKYEYDANGNVVQKTAYGTLLVPQTFTRSFGKKIVSNGKNAEIRTISLPALPEKVRLKTELVLIDVEAMFYMPKTQVYSLTGDTQNSEPGDPVPSSFRNEIRVSLNGATFLAPTQISNEASPGKVTPNPYTLSVPNLSSNGGSVTLALSETVNSTTTQIVGRTATQDEPADATFGEVRLDIVIEEIVDYSAATIATFVAFDSSRDKVTQYAYDAANRQTRTTYPTVGIYGGESNVALMANGATGTASRVETPSSLYMQDYYDATGNIVANRDAAGNMRYQAYDAAGRMRYAVDAEGYVTGYVRDALGNVTALTRYADRIADATRTAWTGNAPALATIAALLTNNITNRTITTEYDASGRAVQITEPSIYAYDGMTASTASPVTRHTYDAFGQITQTQVKKDQSTWLSTYRYYDQRGLEIATIDALKNVTTQGYDAFGNVTKRTEYANPLGSTVDVGTRSYTLPGTSVNDRITLFTFDRNNRRVKETQVNVEYVDTSNLVDAVTLYGSANYSDEGGSVRRQLGVGYFDESNLNGGAVKSNWLSSIKVKAGYQVTLYDNNLGGATHTIEGDTSSLGNFDDKASSIVVSKTQVRGDLETTYQYDSFGNLVKTTDAGNNSTTTYYDRANRTRAVAQAARAIEGNTSFVGLTEFVRDVLGNVTQQIERASGAMNVTLNSYSTISNDSDRINSIRYDSWGRTVEITDALNNVQYMSYDANGNLAKQWQGVVGGDGLARTSFKAFRYDKLGQLVNTIEPSSYGVSIFADSNYQGNSRSFTVGDYNLSELGIGGDMLSSLTVKQGWTVTLYADGNFTGATRTVSANTASLSDFNDQTSSLRITAPSKLTVNNTQMQYNAFGELISKGLVGNDVMWPGDLRADQSIVSANGRYQLIMQPDGNLVTYDLQNNRKVVWKTDTPNNNGSWFAFQPHDGNLVIYTANGDSKWTARTQNDPESKGGFLRLQNDGNLVLYNASGSRAIWSSGVGDIMRPGKLKADQSIVSANGRYQLIMQPDGNLVISDLQNNRQSIWSSGTSNHPGASFSFQASDGNLVIYNAINNAVWNAGTQDDPLSKNGFLRLQNDGNLVLLTADGSLAIWSTRMGLNISTVSLQAMVNIQPLTTMQGDAQSEYFEYNNGGQLWRSNSGDGVSKVMLYDLQGNLTMEIRSASEDLKARADASAALAMTGTRQTRNVYDALGRPVRQVQANGATVYQDRDRWGNMLAVTDARNANWKTEYAYDANNQVIRETKPKASLFDGTDYGNASPVTQYFYDYAGRQVAVRDARGNVNQTVYDAGGNVVSEIRADGGVVSHAYNAFGNETRQTDAMGNVTRHEYDKLGRLTRIIRPSANVAFYRIGQLDAWSDEDAPVALYNDANYSGAVTSFGMGEYDDLGPLAFNSIKVRSGWKVELFDDDSTDSVNNASYTSDVSDVPYDLQDDITGLKVTRIDQVTAAATVVGDGSASDVVITYDALGRQLSRADGSGTTRYEYDIYGNVVRMIRPGNVVTANQYDFQGRKLSEINANGDTMTWRYDYFGKATGRSDLGASSYTFGYDFAGQLKTESNARGRDVRTSYNVAGQVSEIKSSVRQAGSLTASESVTTYGYDLAGNRTSEKTVINGTDYADHTIKYNALGQMVYTGKEGEYIEFNYDAVGNRTKSSQNFGGLTYRHYAYDSMNRMILAEGDTDNNPENTSNLVSGHRITYDKNGNRISDQYKRSVTESYSYDGLGRLTTVWNGAIGTGTKRREIKHDKADLIIQSFDSMTGNSIDAQNYTNVYDDKGRLARQYFSSSAGVDRSAVFNTYDNVGNLTKTVNQTFDQGGFMSRERTTYSRAGDSYKQDSIEGDRKGHSGGAWSGSKTSRLNYDVNGYLLGISDSGEAKNNRTFVNDAQGQILQKTQEGNVLKNMVANGQVLGTYGKGIDTGATPATSRVTIKVTLNVIWENDQNGKGTSEFNLKFTLKDRGSSYQLVSRNASNTNDYISYENITGDTTQHEGGSNQMTYTFKNVEWPPKGFLEIGVLGEEDDDNPDNDDPIVPATYGLDPNSWTREGQVFMHGTTFGNDELSYNFMIQINSEASDPKPTDEIYDFSAFQKIDGAHPGSGPGSYRVNAGDTLQSIAQGAYGDAALWYLIADANGLGANSGLQAGTMLTLPSNVGTVHNNASTFKPYEAGRMIGDTSPTVPAPDGSKCATVGFTILSILAAVVVSALVTVATGGAGAGLGFALMAGVLGGAAGSLASQGVMLLARQQQNFSWTDVAVGAATGLVGAGMGRAATAIGRSLSATAKIFSASLTRSTSLATRAMTGLGNLVNGASKSARALQLVGRAASETVQNVVTDAVGQGIKILAGEQGGFDWKSIAFSAASGAGAGLGAKFGGLGEAIGGIAASGLTNLASNGRDFDMASFAADATSSALSGMSSFLADRRKQSNPNGRKIAITDHSPETAKSVYSYLMKHPDAEIVDVSKLSDAAKVNANDKLVVVGHNNGNASSMMLGSFLTNMDNAPARISLMVCNAASDVNGVNLLQQTVAITQGRSTVSAHTGKIQLGSNGQRIVDSVGSRKLTYGSDGRYTSNASKHAKPELESGWLVKPNNKTTKTDINRHHPYKSENRSGSTENQSVPLFQAWKDYRTPAQLARRTGITPDHIPSVGAAFLRLKAMGVLDSLDRNSGLGRKIAHDMLPTMTVPAIDHQRYSPTYGARNDHKRMDRDAKNYGIAIWRDVFAYTPAFQKRGTSARVAWVEQTRLVDELINANVRAGMMGANENPFPYNKIIRRHSFSA